MPGMAVTMAMSRLGSMSVSSASSACHGCAEVVVGTVGRHEDAQASANHPRHVLGNDVAQVCRVGGIHVVFKGERIIVGNAKCGVSGLSLEGGDIRKSFAHLGLERDDAVSDACH